MGKFFGKSRVPVGLLYHGIPALDDDFVDGESMERHIAFLAKHFDTVSYNDSMESRRKRRPRILLTFDDGYQNNIRVAVPILRRYGVRATFFVCNRHTRRGKYLWFSYLRALEKHYKGDGFRFHEQFIDMSQAHRPESMKRLRTHLLSLRPHPAAMYIEIENHLPAIETFMDSDQLEMNFAGLTEEEIAQLADDRLFSVQAHTVDHPFLTMCDTGEAFLQLSANKTWLEQITGRECSALAYPSGEYDATTITLCKSIGFTQGFAVIPKYLQIPAYEKPRVGVFSKSLAVLALKAHFGHAIRHLGVPVG